MQLVIYVLHIPLELVGLAAVSVVHRGAVLIRLYVQLRWRRHWLCQMVFCLVVDHRSDHGKAGRALRSSSLLHLVILSYIL